jgi:methionyl-tRNA synthetase
VVAEVLRQAGILLQPFVPTVADKLLTQLSIGADERGFAMLGEKGRLKPGTPLGALGAIFPRYEEPKEQAAE